MNSIFGILFKGTQQTRKIAFASGTTYRYRKPAAKQIGINEKIRIPYLQIPFVMFILRYRCDSLYVFSFERSKPLETIFFFARQKCERCCRFFDDNTAIYRRKKCRALPLYFL